MRCVCIIPARGQSKRIPQKNIKEFYGRPIISYAIEKANGLNLFESIVVSTDDSEIKLVAENFGATVPYLRKDEIASDFSTIADVVNDTLLNLRNSGEKYDYACCLLATSVMVSADSIVAGLNQLKSGNFDSVVSVVKYKHPIQRALIDTEGKIEFLNPEYRNSRSQDLKEHFHDAGQWYWFRLEDGLIKNYWPNNTGFLQLREMEFQDIDTDEDWKLAELKYKIIKRYE